MFSITNNSKSIVGLDIEAGSIAATEVRANGSVEVVGHGMAPLEAGAFREGEVTDPEALGGALKEMFAAHKLSRNVRLGIANQRVAVRILRLPALEEKGELEAAIRFQAQDQIPMPLDQAVLDWQVIGAFETEAGQRQVDVVVVAARRDMLASMLDALRHAGLRPEGIDHSAFGMIRALRDAGSTAVDPMLAPEGEVEEGGRLYCNIADVTNLAVAHRGACLFTRVSSFGIEGIAQKLAERRRLTLEHSRQWLSHVGLEHEVEQIEGDPETVAAAREALTEGAAKLADELRMSLEFYGAQEGAVPVEGIVACGPGTTVPGLVERLQQTTGHRFEVGASPALAGFDGATAARLTLSYGLALEE